MELAEPIEYINDQLIRFYGLEPYADDMPRFRVVFSDDQFEKRWMTHTDEGFELIYPEVREVPKYKHYIKGKYVLERVVPIDQTNTDLTVKVGYEPAHVFMTPKEEYLPPRLDMCCVAIDHLLKAAGQKPTVKKYNDPEVDPEYRDKIVKTMMNDLFGNETDTTDALAYKEGIVNPAGQMEFNQTKQNNSTEQVEKGS